MADAPIEPQEFMGGVKVVDIGDLRVARGRTRRPYSTCQHLQLVYDNNERRVYCSDCERDIEPFDAFEMLIERWSASANRLKARERKLVEAESFQARRLVTQRLDKEWRKKNTVPNCPHCNEALLPEDFLEAGYSCSSARIARAKRERGRNG